LPLTVLAPSSPELTQGINDALVSRSCRRHSSFQGLGMVRVCNCLLSVLGYAYIYKKVCYRWLHSAPRAKRDTRILSVGGRWL